MYYCIVFLFLAMAIPVHRNKKEDDEETGRQADPSEAKKLRRGLTLTLTPSLLSSGESKKRSRAVLSSTSTHGDLHLQRRRDGALLRLPRRRRRARLLLHGRRLRDGQERCRRRVHGRHAPRARHEVHRPRRHGWSPRYLRPHHRRHHLHRDQPQGQVLLPLRRLRAPFLRTRMRPRGARRRHGHRHRRRRRSQGECTAAKVVCGHDSDSYLRRSSCSLWSHRWYHPLIPCWPISRRLEGLIYGTRVICHCIQSVLFSVNISSGIMLSLLHLCNIILLFCEDKPS